MINIVTKSSKETTGGLINVGGGDEEKGFGALRYGGKFGNNAYYRVYAKYSTRDDAVFPSGVRGWDEWDISQGGFRSDWDISDNNTLTLHGDIYNGHDGTSLASKTTAIPETVKGTTDVAGGNIIARWNHTFSETSNTVTQLYYDRAERRDELRQIVNTVDLDIHHQFALGQRQRFILGGGYRIVDNELDNNDDFFIEFEPEIRSDNLFNVFAQDEIELVADRLRLTLGSKFEMNDYTGFELQPNARILWTPNEQHTFWAAVSRAVRTPSRLENDINLDLHVNENPSIHIHQHGNRDFMSENLIANEIGYRTQPFRNLSFDVALFYNVYDDLYTLEQSSPSFRATPDPQLIFAQRADNNMDGETYGVEIAVNYQATDTLRIFAGYTYLQMELHPGALSVSPFASGSNESPNQLEGDNPHHQFQLRSYLNLPFNLEFDASLYYVDSLPSQDVSSYLRLDSRLGWKPSEKLEMSIVFQNLLDPDHQEFGSVYGKDATEVERGVYGQITLKW